VTPRRVAGAVAALAGLAALGLAGPLAVVVPVVAAVIGLAPWLRPWMRSVPWAVATVGVVALLAGGAWAGVAPFALVAALLAYLQAHRHLTRAGPADDRASIVLAGGMVVAGAAAGGASVGGAALVWALALPLALLPAGALGWPAALGLGAVAAAVALPLASLAPRRPAPPIAAMSPAALTGFSPQLQLGAIGPLLADPTAVFRATAHPAPVGPIYWRGLALDWFDGTHWRSTTPPRAATLAEPVPLDGVHLRVALQPTPEGVLFTAGRPLQLDVAGGAARSDPQGGWFAEGPGTLTYTMWSRGPFGPSGVPLLPPQSGAALARSRHLPEGLDPRVGELAAEIAGVGPPAAKVERLAAHLRQAYSYTRRAPPPAAAPLTAFLLERRTGHCEYFSSALAVMARSQGIPARVINGFVGGDSVGDGVWVVRRHHAHSWVEVHYDRVGWVAVDATAGPAAPVATAAAPGAPRASWALPIGAALLGVLGVGWVFARGVGLGGPVPDRVTRAHAAARRHIAACGISIPPQLPPVAAAEHVREVAPGAAADALLQLAWLLYEVRLGGASAAAHAPHARSLLKGVRRLSGSAVTSAA